VLKAYEAVSGYDPRTGENDNGAVEIDVLNYWRRNGIGGRKFDAYVALEPRNHEHIRDSIHLFGGCYVGLALPVSAQRQRTWTVPPGGPTGPGAPGSWGGHAVVLVAYNPRRVTCITWGEEKQMTWAFSTRTATRHTPCLASTIGCTTTARRRTGLNSRRCARI
jgi:hypothetical protein